MSGCEHVTVRSPRPLAKNSSFASIVNRSAFDVPGNTAMSFGPLMKVGSECRTGGGFGGRSVLVKLVSPFPPMLLELETLQTRRKRAADLLRNFERRPLRAGRSDRLTDQLGIQLAQLVPAVEEAGELALQTNCLLARTHAGTICGEEVCPDLRSAEDPSRR